MFVIDLLTVVGCLAALCGLAIYPVVGRLVEAAERVEWRFE